MIGFRTLVLLLEAGYSVRAAVRNQAGFERIAALKQISPFRSQLSSVLVPDITVPHAYDDAVKGVKYIIHIASPVIGSLESDQYETDLIQPAIRGTVGMLESALQAPGIERIVITSSVTSIAGHEKIISGDIIDGEFPLMTWPEPQH